MKRRFRCIESSFFCDFFDFGGGKLLFCAVHTHVSWSFLLRRGFAPAGATRGLCARPLDPFAVHTPMLWGFIFLCYIEHLTRTAGSLDKHAGTLCSCAQPNRAEGSREKLPCGLKGQRPLGSPNKHAEEVCRSHQLNRAKGSPEGRRPFGRVKGQRPLGFP